MEKSSMFCFERQVNRIVMVRGKKQKQNWEIFILLIWKFSLGWKSQVRCQELLDQVNKERLMNFSPEEIISYGLALKLVILLENFVIDQFLFSPYKQRMVNNLKF